MSPTWDKCGFETCRLFSLFFCFTNLNYYNRNHNGHVTIPKEVEGQQQTDSRTGHSRHIRVLSSWCVFFLLIINYWNASPMVGPFKGNLYLFNYIFYFYL